MAFTIRPHQKSRGGCVLCKARRVKCDEARPTCRHCARRGTECVYTEPQKRRRAAPPQPAPSLSHPQQTADDADADAETDLDAGAGAGVATPSEASTSSSSSFSPSAHAPQVVARAKPKPKARPRPKPGPDGPWPSGGPPLPSSVPRSPPSGYTPEHMLDLRLMHQYATSTATSIVDILQMNPMAAEGLKTHIPNLATEHPFLMDAILGIAAIHIGSCKSPDAVDPLPVVRYRDKALYNLRTATMSLSAQNLRPVHMASMLLAVTSLAADRTTNFPGLWVANWIAMASGPRVLTETLRTPPPSPTQGPERPVPVHRPGSNTDRLTPAIMPIDLDKVLDIAKGDEDWGHRGVLHEAANGIAELFGALCVMPEGGLPLEFKVRSWPFSLTSNYFLELVRAERPRALVILAYFLAFVSYLPDMWLYQGVAAQDMAKVVKMVDDPFWREFLNVPRAALTVEDRLARSAFLRTQLCGQSPRTLSSPQLSLQAWSLVGGAGGGGRGGG